MKKPMATKVVNNNKKHIIMGLGVVAVAVLSTFAPDVFALAADDTLPELSEIVTTTDKMTKTFCYIIGSASAAVGGYRFVQTQSLATAGLAGAISIASFKFPALITASALI